MHYQRVWKTGVAGVAESTPGRRHPTEIDTRTCNKCGEEKHVELFNTSKRSKTGRFAECKACIRITKRIRETNITATHAEVRAWLLRQDLACHICGDEPGTDIDHCHTTGRLRGLLCRKCNVMLGLSRDNLRILAKAAEYLAKG